MYIYIHAHTHLSSVNGHLHCFHAIISNAVMNLGVPISFRIRIFVFSGYMPRSGLVDHMVSIFLV